MIDFESADLSPEALRRLYAHVPSGVVALCGLVDDEPCGLAASTFVPVSLTPPIVSVCLQTTSRTWPRLRPRSRLGVSVLGRDQDAVCRALSGPGDRFAGTDWRADTHGGVVVAGATAWLSCSSLSEVPAGDHVVALLAVHAWTVSATPPLVFQAHRFHGLSAAS